MIPVGYMAKRVSLRSEWLNVDRIKDIYSVSHCISNSFTDDFTFWKHNGYWFYDSPEIIRQLAQENNIDLTGTAIFYYEAYESEFDNDTGEWKSFRPDTAFTTAVLPPLNKTLEGHDVVTFGGFSVECSPLSCNSVATEVETNSHCLLDSFEQAKQLIEDGAFSNTEPGRQRILAVYSTDWS